jgi:CHASE3 domain sensor protein
MELENFSPPSEAWHKIEAKLKEKTQTTKAFEPRKRWLFSPAIFRYSLISVLLLVIAIGVTIITPHYLKKEKSEINQQEYVLAKLKEAEHHYQLAIKALKEAISSQKGSLDPQVAKAFQENLRIINASINACKKAVLMEPDNLEARDYLLSAYQQKVNFLNEIINYSQRNLESIL